MSAIEWAALWRREWRGQRAVFWFLAGSALLLTPVLCWASLILEVGSTSFLNTLISSSLIATAVLLGHDLLRGEMQGKARKLSSRIPASPSRQALVKFAFLLTMTVAVGAAATLSSQLYAQAFEPELVLALDYDQFLVFLVSLTLGMGLWSLGIPALFPRLGIAGAVAGAALWFLPMRYGEHLALAWHGGRILLVYLGLIGGMALLAWHRFGTNLGRPRVRRRWTLATPFLVVAAFVGWVQYDWYRLDWNQTWRSYYALGSDGRAFATTSNEGGKPSHLLAIDLEDGSHRALEVEGSMLGPAYLWEAPLFAPNRSIPSPLHCVLGPNLEVRCLIDNQGQVVAQPGQLLGPKLREQLRTWQRQHSPILLPDGRKAWFENYRLVADSDSGVRPLEWARGWGKEKNLRIVGYGLAAKGKLLDFFHQRTFVNEKTRWTLVTEIGWMILRQNSRKYSFVLHDPMTLESEPIDWFGGGWPRLRGHRRILCENLQDKSVFAYLFDPATRSKVSVPNPEIEHLQGGSVGHVSGDWMVGRFWAGPKKSQTHYWLGLLNLRTLQWTKLCEVHPSLKAVGMQDDGSLLVSIFGTNNALSELDWDTGEHRPLFPRTGAR